MPNNKIINFVKRFPKTSIASVILMLIVLLGLLLRLYRLSQMVGFDADAEFAAMFAAEILKMHHFRAIGQQLSVAGLFMGPWYFYYLVPFFWLTNLHPFGGYLGSAVLGLITIGAYYFFVKSVFGVRAGLLAAFFRAILFYFITIDQGMTPGFSVDLIVLFVWYFSLRFWQGNLAFLMPLSFVLGMFTSFNPTLFPFYFVFLIVTLGKRKIPDFKVIICSVILFLLPIVPLLIFEYKRNFASIATLFNLRHSGNGETKNIFTLWEYIKIFVIYPVSVFGLPLVETAAVIVSALLYWLTCSFNEFLRIKRSFHLVFIVLTVLIFIVYYYLLPIHVPYYYFYGAQSVVFIYLSVGLSRLVSQKKKLVFSVIIVSVILFNLMSLKDALLSRDRISLWAKEAVILKIRKENKNNAFDLKYDVDLGQQFGLGYLARYYGLDPKGGASVPRYTIVIPKSRRANELTESYGGVGLIKE